MKKCNENSKLMKLNEKKIDLIRFKSILIPLKIEKNKAGKNGFKSI